jgi:ammonia channel protein AmtB
LFSVVTVTWLTVGYGIYMSHDDCFSIIKGLCIYYQNLNENTQQR